MKDSIFYPLCVLTMAAMFGVAVLPGLGRLPETPFSGDGSAAGYGSLTIEGRDLNRIKAGGPVEITLMQDADPWVVRIGHEAGQGGQAYDEGAYFPLGPDFEVQYGGRDLRVDIDMAPTSDWGARSVEVMYATGMQADSGWQRFDLNPEYTTYSFTFTPPPFNGVNGLDYLAIRPVVESKRGFINVSRIAFSKAD